MEYDYTGQDKVQAKNEEMLQTLHQEANNTSKAYDELREIGAREEIDRMTRRQDADESMAAAIAATPENGSLSDAQVKYLNSKRGLKVDGGDIQNGQIMEAGFNPKTGGYGVVFASVDANGNVSYQPHEIPQTEIYGMMSGRPEWFGAERIGRLGAAIQKTDPSYTNDRLKALGEKYIRERNALSGRIMNARANLPDRNGGHFWRMQLAQMRRNDKDQKSGRYERIRNEAIMKMVPELAKETVLDFSEDANGKPVPKYKNDEDLVAAAVNRYDAIQRAINNGFAPPEGMDPVLAKHLGYAVNEPVQLKSEKSGLKDDEKISESNPFGKWIKKKNGGKNASKSDRNQDDVLANPHDGDQLPLKGGGTARYNGKTKKWEEAVA